MPKNSLNVSLKGADDIFSTEESRQKQQREQVQQIPIGELFPFKNHPFKVLDDESMQRTVESVEQYGVLSPLIARPRPEGGYEIISGHRRQHAAQLAGLDTLPVIVRNMDDDAAVLLMVDSNLQRENILPSERAFAYKMKLEALKNQGARSDLTSSQVGMKLQALDIVGQEAGDSRNQVHRFIRLTSLIPELLDMVDEKKIAFNPAVELSYLDESQQRDFLEAMQDTQNAPSLSQAQRLKKLAQEGHFSYDVAFAVMGEEKKGELDKVVIKNDTLRKYFPRSYTPKQMEDTIIKLLDADDFKIFCSSHTDAVKAYHATAKWLKDRLGLDISPEKSRIVNLKRQYSEFLGFKLKVQKRSNKYVVKSHMCDKAYKKVQKKLTEEVKKLEHSADDKAQFMQLMTYNAVVAGIHQYYCIATAASEDFGKLAYGVKKQMHNRLRNDLTRKGELKKGYIKEKYGKSSQLRFLHGRPVVPIGYVQSRNAQHKRKSVNKYTPEGRELIHKNLNIDTKTMLWLMRNPVQGRSIEYADNRISLYAAQHGKCAVTGSIMEAHDIHCHHKRPAAKGGTDEYGNLVLISAPVHKLIHASDMATIKFYLNLLNLDSTQILKLNKFREMAEMPLID